MPIPTIEWKKNSVKIVDQTLLPGRLKFIYCRSAESLRHAIKKLKIRGAPAIGVAAAFGVYLGVKREDKNLFKKLDKIVGYLAASRPTARNLFWALERMRRAAYTNKNKPSGKIKEILLEEAKKILKEDTEICRRIGRFGNKLVKNHATILTHCNAGGLATADYGTALGVIFTARASGKKIKVYADETRPVLQGARLTAWELLNEGVDTTLICDNMAGALMAKGKIGMVIVGADRIAKNGDTANKIGTYSLAILARHHKVPFYVAAPLSTIDLSIPDGKHIPIEERHPDEIRKIKNILITPKKVKVFNPAFDVTPHEFITAIITEKGIMRKPFLKSLKAAHNRALR